jgi:L-threonylcarbamoyladenylate synthase
MTEIIVVNPQTPQPDRIAYAASLIQQGKLVAFPTETVYGLGANALDEKAVARIFEAKERPMDDPLIVHLASREDLSIVAKDIPEIAYLLIEAFWPGPLTLVLPKQDIVPMNVTAGLDTVAVRIPDHPVALALIRASKVPIAAPSANRFSKVSPTTAEHVLHDLDGRIELILDCGPTSVGVESTVLNIMTTPPVILRPGGISREAIESLIGRVMVFGEVGKGHLEAPPVIHGPSPSPGLLPRHYTPRARLILVKGTSNRVLEEMASLSRLHLSDGVQVGLLITDEEKPYFERLPVRIVTLGPAGDLIQIARNLYAGMRMLDAQGVDVIIAHDFGKSGLGLAINDRLRRAASQIIDL